MARASLLLAVALVAIGGCRETITGVDDPPLDLSPRVVGAWAGAYVGRLGLIGSTEAPFDTFRVEVDIVRVGVDFAYTGEVFRGGRDPVYVYGCAPAPLTVDTERRLTVSCVQGTQLGDTLILRLDVQADTAFQALSGVVRDVVGVPGETYPIELRRDAP